jgi:hypothetical protein
MTQKDLIKVYADKVRTVIDPKGLKEVRARAGTDLLMQMDDRELLVWFKKMFKDKRSPTELAMELMAAKKLRRGSYEQTLVLAFRRLSIVGIPIHKEIEAEKAKKQAAKAFAGGPANQSGEVQVIASDNSPLPLELSPENNFEMVIMDCKAQSLMTSGMDELKLLVEVQKRRLLRMLRHYSNLPNPFLSSRLIDQTVDIYRRSLDTLIDAQIRTGTLPQVATPIDVRLQGAFASFHQDLNDGPAGSKDLMLDAVLKFVDMVQNDYAAKLLPDISGLGRGNADTKA